MAKLVTLTQATDWRTKYESLVNAIEQQLDAGHADVSRLAKVRNDLQSPYGSYAYGQAQDKVCEALGKVTALYDIWQTAKNISKE